MEHSVVNTVSDKYNDFEEIIEHLEGTNINRNTFLATDYLNHFNEIVMIMEMIPDMPEMLDECYMWTPKTYVEHFKASTFKDKELAVKAYKAAPEEHRNAFEEAVMQLDFIVVQSLERVNLAITKGDENITRLWVANAVTSINVFIELIGNIISGTHVKLDQSSIDTIMLS
jgi:hypothetical protein